MTWIKCAPFLLYGFLYTNALLFHGSQTNATSSTSSGQLDSNDHQRLLHLETVLDLVIKELNSVNQENQLLQLKQTTLEREVQVIKQWNQTMETKLQAAETKITILEDSLKAVISENKQLKDRVDILNSSSTTSQLTIQQTVRDSEEKIMKNMSATVRDMNLQDRYLSLSLLDVNSNMTILHSNMTILDQTLSQLKQHQKTHEEQQNITIKQLTHSLQNNTVKLSNILSSLQTRVAFTAGIHYDDKRNFAPSETVKFPQVIYQVGGGYNPTTGVFTAPRAGLYLIFCTNVADFHETFWSKIMINGSVKAGVMAHVGTSSMLVQQSASNLVVHQLQVGDRVWIEVYYGNHLYSRFPDTTFSVVMINESLI